jgi:hypothetical protein
MNRLAFVYVPTLDGDRVRNVFRALLTFGFEISHIGKDDPPSKHTLAIDEAVDFVCRRNGPGTNTTFVADQNSCIELTFEDRDDPRWDFSTISIVFPATMPGHQVCEHICDHLRPFACICGREGAGQNQDWDVVFIDDACPERIKVAFGSPT